jgi:hypothetical protein
MNASRSVRRGTQCKRSLVGLVSVLALIMLAAPLATGAVPADTAVASSGAAGGRTTTSALTATVPVYAYFYQWFNPSSWRRAKFDKPLIGGYSSDDPRVLRKQVAMAKSAGITGFLTSWKSTTPLNRRLNLLIRIARSEQLDLGVVYEALDFTRKPLPVTTVKRDMVYLVDRWTDDLRSSRFARPVIIWTGTDDYSVADVRAVRTALGRRAYLLSASKSVAGYERVAGLVDGEAYYWSSANPKKPATSAKLSAMGAAVHAHNGIWIAPAASGFDGRSLNHTRVIEREGGATLVRSLDAAYRSAPDAVGVISWNEWSENTYIEPGQRYGSEELNTLRGYLLNREHRAPSPPAIARRPPAAIVNWSGLMAVVTLSIVTCLGAVFVAWTGRRRARGRDVIGV